MQNHVWREEGLGAERSAMLKEKRKSYSHSCNLSIFQLIHEISEENGGVIVSFPRAGSNSDKVTLKGATQCIDGAKTRIQEIINDLVSNLECCTLISGNVHYLFLLRGGGLEFILIKGVEVWNLFLLRVEVCD